jgi:hypothetical protein
MEIRMSNKQSSGHQASGPGTQNNPQGIPQMGHGGSNQRGTQHTQGKDGNGAQKRQQQKKTD